MIKLEVEKNKVLIEIRTTRTNNLLFMLQSALDYVVENQNNKDPALQDLKTLKHIKQLAACVERECVKKLEKLNK